MDVSEQPQGATTRRLNARRLALVALVGMLGLLLWARVIVIARMPRVAVAEDEAAQKAMQQEAAPPARKEPGGASPN